MYGLGRFYRQARDSAVALSSGRPHWPWSIVRARLRRWDDGLALACPVLERVEDPKDLIDADGDARNALAIRSLRAAEPQAAALDRGGGARGEGRRGRASHRASLDALGYRGTFIP
jgi:hypothetical protein